MAWTKESKPGGRPANVLTKEDVERAIRNTPSNSAAARFCRVSYPTYKKYAKLYVDENGVSLWDKHISTGKGIPRFRSKGFGEIPRDKWGRAKEPKMTDIISGRATAHYYNPEKIKYRMIQMGLLEDRCYQCGYNAKRPVDGRSPLVLVHKNGNKDDWHLDNLEFLCYNCMFLNGPVKGIPEVTEDMILKEYCPEQVKAWDKNKEKPVWEPDEEYQEDYLKELFGEDEYKPGSEFISKI